MANLVAMLETYDAKLSKIMDRDIKMIDKFSNTDLNLNPINQKLTKGINKMVYDMEISDKLTNTDLKFNPIDTKFIKGISKIMVKGMNIADKFTNTGLNLNFVKDG